MPTQQQIADHYGVGLRTVSFQYKKYKMYEGLTRLYKVLDYFERKMAEKREEERLLDLVMPIDNK